MPRSQFLAALYADQPSPAEARLLTLPRAGKLSFARPHKAGAWPKTLGVALVVIALLALELKSHQQHYLAISLAIMALSLGNCCLRFEKRHPSARELVVIAVLVALAVAGRAAFFMLAQFKPVAAIVIIAGAAYGADVGFLVGALAALVSNLFFMQGPWTPWQMVAFGVIGWLAGSLAWRNWLPLKRGALALFGFFAVMLVYGGIMNPAALLMYGRVLTPQALMTIYISGAPMDLVHAGATVIFLVTIGLPLLRKLARIQAQYGVFDD